MNLWNQLQNLIPGLLEAILAWLWASRMDWLYWYDEQGVRFLTPEERAIAAEQRAERLAQELRKLGIDPDGLS